MLLRAKKTLHGPFPHPFCNNNVTSLFELAVPILHETNAETRRSRTKMTHFNSGTDGRPKILCSPSTETATLLNQNHIKQEPRRQWPQTTVRNPSRMPSLEKRREEKRRALRAQASLTHNTTIDALWLLHHPHTNLYSTTHLTSPSPSANTRVTPAQKKTNST
jgi:hypothetical protein